MKLKNRRVLSPNILNFNRNCQKKSEKLKSAENSNHELTCKIICLEEEVLSLKSHIGSIETQGPMQTEKTPMQPKRPEKNTKVKEQR